MAQQSKKSTARRTLHYYWAATSKHLGLFIGLMLSSIGFIVLLSYGNPLLMSMIVDRVSETPVAPDQVFEVFGPYIIALIAISLIAVFTYFSRGVGKKVAGATEAISESEGSDAKSAVENIDTDVIKKLGE